MNEIKKIHLGRQPFTVAVDAHKVLRAYLEAIEHQVGSKSEVLKEVELRMAELLAERGIKDDKVVLLEDVEFLKEQLGEPQDFKDETADEAASEESAQHAPKRLFRDTDNAMLAGVASGLAAYFGIDAVIVRLVFIVTLFWGGMGLLAYIILWLVVPEAKTNSDRLQMQGKAVTVDSLKQVVDRADVQGATKRASRVLGKFIEKASAIVLAIIGVSFVIASIVAFLSVAVAGSYLLIHGGQVASEVVYPVGTRAVISLICAMVAGSIIALALMFIGLAMVRRKWFVPGWVAAATLGVFIVAGSIGMALAFDIAPGIRDKYNSMHHVQNVGLAPFTTLKIVGNESASIEYQESKTYFVEMRYFGSENQDLGIKSNVKDGQLELDTRSYKAHSEDCTYVCLYNDHAVKVVVHAPSLSDISISGSNAYFEAHGLTQPSLHVEAASDSYVSIDGTSAVSARAMLRQDQTREVRLTDLKKIDDAGVNMLQFSTDLTAIDNLSDSFELNESARCDEYQPLVYLNQMPSKILIGQRIIMSEQDLLDLRSPNTKNVYNCIVTN